MSELDPQTVPLEADLSRADVALLCELALGKSVVEFGCGGSTPLLAQVASSLRSYDTDPAWVERVQRTMQQREAEGVRYCPWAIVCNRAKRPPADVEPADVLFVDGLMRDRPRWVEAGITRRLAPVIVLHDSRRERPLVLCGCLITWPFTAWIDSVVYHAAESNCVVIRLRPRPVRYENWNQTEQANRLPHLHSEDR